MDQLRRLSNVLDRPVLYLTTGDAIPRRGALSAELRWWGLDVREGDELLWAVRPAEECLVDALVDPRPRVIDRLAALFFLQPQLEPELLVAHARIHGVGRRLGWLRDVAATLVRLDVGRETRGMRGLDVAPFLPSESDPWDGLGHPAAGRDGLPHAWRRWRIDYDRSPAEIRQVVAPLVR